MNYKNRIGINTHLRYTDTVYNENLKILSVLQQLGVTHLRDGGFSKEWKERVKYFGRYGFRFTLVIDPRDGWTPENLVNNLADIVPYIDMLEGPNETDLGINYSPLMCPGYPDALKEFYTACYTALKASPFNYIPFIAPSVGMAFDSWKLGIVSCNYGNMHPYPNGTLPEINAEWNWRWIENSRKNCGGLPIIATEVGYHTATNGTQKGVREKEQAIMLVEYIKRLLTQAKLHRVFVYELMDLKPTNEQENRWGIVRNNFTPKPAFNAVKAMLK